MIPIYDLCIYVTAFKVCSIQLATCKLVLFTHIELLIYSVFKMVCKLTNISTHAIEKWLLYCLNPCFIYYSCSVPCCKQHKLKPCSPPPPPLNNGEDQKDLQITYDFPTEDTVPLEKLLLLG